MRWHDKYPTEYFPLITLARSYHRRCTAERTARDWHYLSARAIAHRVVHVVYSPFPVQRYRLTFFSRDLRRNSPAETIPGEIETIAEEERVKSSFQRLLAVYFPEPPAALIFRFLFRPDLCTY